MTTLKAAVEHVKHLAHTETTGPGDIDAAVRERTINVCYPVDTAGATREYMVWQADYDCTIVSATVLPCAAATADNTDYKTVTLRTETNAAAAVATVGFLHTDANGTPVGASWAIGVGLEIPITVANAAVAAGNNIMLDATHAGAGVAIDFILQVKVRYD